MWLLEACDMVKQTRLLKNRFWSPWPDSTHIIEHDDKQTVSVPWYSVFYHDGHL